MSQMCQEATYETQQTPPLFDHLVDAGEQVGGTSRPSVLAVLRLIHSLYRACTGSSDGFRL